jgi:predicted lipoprotein with Yx(FWY)xxD motif
MASLGWPTREWGRGPAPTTRSKGTGTPAWVLAGLLFAAGLTVVTAPGVAGASHAKTIKVGTANIAHVGTVLTNGSGHTLYYFSGAPARTVTCTGACAKIWLPYMASKGAHISGPKGVKGLSLISAGRGHWQVAFDQAALYRFEGDSKKGQAKGQGVIGKWFAAMKSGIPAAPAAGAAVTVPTSPASTTTAPAPTTTPTTASHAAPTMPGQQTPATAPPPPAPTTTPPTAPPPPPPTTTTPTTSPPTTTTTAAGGGGGGVGF